jgi:hypothetical protein
MICIGSKKCEWVISFLRQGLQHACRCCLIWVLWFPVWGTLPGTYAGSSAPSFVAQTASATPVSGPLKALAADWTVRLGGLAEQEVAGNNLICLRQAAPLPPPPTGPQVLLTDGSRLPVQADSLHLEKELLQVQPLPPLRAPAGLALPLSRIALLWLAPAAESTADPPARLAQQVSDQDCLFLQSGDQVTGTVLALDSRSCRLQRAGRLQTLATDSLQAIAFASTLRVRPQPRQPWAHLVLSNGGRLELAQAQLASAARELRGRTLSGIGIAVPLQDVLALDLRQGRAVYLSDLEPIEQLHLPFLGIPWPMRRDASVTGAPLRLAGSCYDKGLGLHADCRLTYALQGEYERFQALVGLHELGTRQGRVQIALQTDQQAAPLLCRQLRAGEVLPVNVSLRGAQRLTLTVQGAGWGDVQARVDWADACLVRRVARPQPASQGSP